MKKILFLVLVVFACSRETPNTSDELLNAGEFKEKMNDGASLIDVRTPQEYSSGKIPGALNLDFKAADFEQRIDTLDKSQTYLLYCASGARSTRAAEIMKRKGFESVLTLEGGVEAWSVAGFSLQ